MQPQAETAQTTMSCESHFTNRQDRIAPKYKVLKRDCVIMFLFALCSVSGMAQAAPAMKVQRRRGIAEVLLGYLKKSASVISKPGRADVVNRAMLLLVWEGPWA